MKKFTIIHNLMATVSIEVLAETREEALEKASKNNIDPCDYDFELDSAEVGNEEEVQDLQVLIEQAEAIMKSDEDGITLNPWLRVTLEYWNGENIVHKHDLMDCIFWNQDDDEIGFNSSSSAADYNLSELPEIEQYKVCQAIIQAAKDAQSNSIDTAVL